MRARLRVAATAAVAATGLLLAGCSGGDTNQVANAAYSYKVVHPTTPIQHVVVAFGYVPK